MSDLQKLLSLLFLKSAPQDLSYSSRLMVQLAAAYVFSGFIVLQTTLNPEDMFAGILLAGIRSIYSCSFLDHTGPVIQADLQSWLENRRRFRLR